MNNGMKVFLAVCAAIIVAAIAIADPNGPSAYIVGNSERGSVGDSPPAQINAQAGNITELVFNATSITRTWQGYFGNISGKLTLDDANNWTLYDWVLANPRGRVYAARINTVTWENIGCMDFAANGSLYPNLTTEETLLGVVSTDADGVDETFALTNHPTLTIGSKSIGANTCKSTFLYVNDTTQSANFREVLLTDNSSNNSVIYTAILEQKVHGFNNRTMDFQLIVGENGHGNSDTTQYYFWVELE